MKKRYSKILATVMVVAILIGNGNMVNAAPKTMTVDIPEGEMNVSTLTRTVSIPNLKSVVSAKVTKGGGTVTTSISGNNVTVKASAGTPTRLVNNPQKESKIVTDVRDQKLDINFPATITYNSGGFTGKLNKEGNYKQIGGSPKSSNNVRDIPGFHAYDTLRDCETYSHAEILYQDGVEGSGRLSFQGVCFRRPGNNDYIGLYTGTLTVPDTREYRQNYKGTVYKAGNDNYYAYTVILEYVDNTAPTLSIGIIAPQTINKDGMVTISGTVTDPDTDTITISSTINGKTKSTTIAGPSVNAPWTLTWTGEELGEGKYTTATITANDGKSGADSKTYNGTIVVDRTKPTMKISIRK